MPMRTNAFDNAMDFCEAVDMWKQHALDPVTERLFSDVLASICWMATCLLCKKAEFNGYTARFLSADMQATLVLHALEKTRIVSIDTGNPRRAVNYYINMAQNYLRDEADKLRRRRRAGFERIDAIDPNIATICCDLSGEKRENHSWRPELLDK